MGMFALGKAASALACACLFSACSNRTEHPAANPAATDMSVADRKHTWLRAAQGAADFHRSLSALDRIAGLMRAAADTDGIAPSAALLRGYGSGPAAHEPLAGQPTTLAALIKSAAPARPRRLGPAPHGRTALGKRAASDGADAEAPPDMYFEGDSSWFNYRDSARGQVHWIHEFRDPDWGVLSVVRDSLTYQWPDLDSVPVLISSSTSMRPFYGGEFRLELSDEDGDGTLNSARAGAAVRVRKLWRAAAGDTVRKSVWHLDHGVPGDAGEVGEGSPRSFTDTTWIKGKVVAWSIAWDGDGDGLALEAALGKELVVKTEAFAMDDYGRSDYTRIASGAGPDGDWFTEGDNAWFAYGRSLIANGGDTLSHSEAGDADGDGFFFNPSASANRVWEIHRLPCGAGCASYSDSLVKSLGDIADAGDDRIEFAVSRVRWNDGSESVLRTGPERGAADFGMGDTVEAIENRVWPAARAGAHADGAPDSLVREFRLAIGSLADPGDDKPGAISVRTWYGAGDAWEETSELHRDARMTYTASLSGGRRAAGAYDARTGRFEDTLFLVGAGRDIHAGGYDLRDGSAGYDAQRAGRAPAHVSVERLGDGFTVTLTAEGDSARYSQLGDSTWWIQEGAAGPVRHTAVVDGEGGYRLTLTVLDRDGVVTGLGEFAFTAAGAGSGWVAGPGRGDQARLEYSTLPEGEVLAGKLSP